MIHTLKTSERIRVPWFLVNHETFPDHVFFGGLLSEKIVFLSDDKIFLGLCVLRIGYLMDEVADSAFFDDLILQGIALVH